MGSEAVLSCEKYINYNIATGRQTETCVRSKKPRRIKTITGNDIFTSLRCKKVQIPTKQFKELFSLCPKHFR